MLAMTLLALITLAAVMAPAATAQPAYRYRVLAEINRVRAAHGLGRLEMATTLRYAALGHSRDMLARHYFDHTSPSGVTLGMRVNRCGFLRYGSWWAGEDLAWGSGSYGTPVGIVRMWLNSSSHRAILLSPTPTHVGISRVVGTFQGVAGASVVTADFASR